MDLNRASLRVALDVGESDGRYDAQLYAVIYADVLMLCRLPFDYYVLEEAARSQPDCFPELSHDYEALLGAVVGIIGEGVLDRSFHPCDAHAEAVYILAVNEGIQHRFHRPESTGLLAHRTVRSGEGARTAEGPASLGDGGVCSLSAFAPEDAAHAAATGTVARLITSGTAAEARSEAGKRGWIDG